MVTQVMSVKKDALLNHDATVMNMVYKRFCQQTNSESLGILSQLLLVVKQMDLMILLLY